MNLSFLQFLAGAAVISLSGVMAPGPLSAVTLGKGSESPHAGAFIALGHGIVEFPLMTLILLGFGKVFGIAGVKPAIAMAGGVVLLVMAAGMFKNLRGDGMRAAGSGRSPLAAGVILSAANPYFLVWWATVGATMIMEAAGFGAAGVIIFMALHWLCDLSWSWFLSALSYRGGRFFGDRFQKTVFAASGTLLAAFSVKFIYEAAKSFL